MQSRTGLPSIQSVAEGSGVPSPPIQEVLPHCPSVTRVALMGRRSRESSGGVGALDEQLAPRG